MGKDRESVDQQHHPPSTTSPAPSQHPRDPKMQAPRNDGTVPNEYLNNFTIRSIATFMKANGDVYGGAFGRVNIRRGDLRNQDNQATVRSTSTSNA
uniref:Uncharacterized protein n=1 Tax=Caenorhabditis japonica TaxID=281687 RepID=A0A8R1HMA2_CAEJA